MMNLPTKPGVYQDERGRAFALYKGKWFFLVLGRPVDWQEQNVRELVPLAAASGNIEPDFKPFRSRRIEWNIEEG